MLITFTHAYRPCWLANAIELCTKQTCNHVCVTQPLAMYKTLILPTKMLVRTTVCSLHISWEGSISKTGCMRCDSRAIADDTRRDFVSFSMVLTAIFKFVKFKNSDFGGKNKKVSFPI